MTKLRTDPSAGHLINPIWTVPGGEGAELLFCLNFPKPSAKVPRWMHPNSLPTTPYHSFVHSTLLVLFNSSLPTPQHSLPLSFRRWLSGAISQFQVLAFSLCSVRTVHLNAAAWPRVSFRRQQPFRPSSLSGDLNPFSHYLFSTPTRITLWPIASIVFRLHTF